MEFKVGSLMNLISGKSDNKGSSKQSGSEKIIFKHNPKAAHKKQSGSPTDVDKTSRKKSRSNLQNNHQSLKSQNTNQKNLSQKSSRIFQGKFKRDVLTKSFKNRKITQASKPEFAENLSESVVGKSFKYVNSDAPSNAGDTPDGSNSDDKLERTVFVGNLPLTKISDTTVRKLFAPFGEVESFRLRSIPLKDLRFSRKVAAIKNDFHPDRTSTNVYVVMKTKAAAEAALALNGTVLDSHHLRVDGATPKEVDPRKTIFLGNVSFKAEEDDLWTLFEQCGDIDYVRILRDKETSVSKGSAYVNFKSADSVELALKMEGVAEINGRLLKIHRWMPGQRRSQAASSRKPGPRNTKDNVTKDEKARSKEEERFQKKMKRRERREALNAKNEAMGVRSRPLKDVSSKQPVSDFVGVKADGVKQKKKKKKFNKGEVQRKKVAKILASVKSDSVKSTEPLKVVDIDEQPSSSTSVAVPAAFPNQSAKKSKKLLKGKVMKKTAQQTILLEEKGEIKKKKLKKMKSKRA